MPQPLNNSFNFISEEKWQMWDFPLSLNTSKRNNNKNVLSVICFLPFIFKQSGTTCWVTQVITQHLPLSLLTQLHTLWLIRAGVKGLYDTREWRHYRGSSVTHEDGLYRSLGRYQRTSMWFMFLASSSSLTHLYSFFQRERLMFLWNALVIFTHLHCFSATCATPTLCRYKTWHFDILGTGEDWTW